MARMLDLTYEDTGAPVTARDAAIYKEVTKPAAKPRKDPAVEVVPGAVARVAFLANQQQGGLYTSLAILYLDSLCDGAHNIDGVGFSGYDADFGKSLATGIKKYGDLTVRQFPSAQRLCHKYRQQLRAAGFDMDRIANEKHPRADLTPPAEGRKLEVTEPAPRSNTGRYQRITLSIRIVRRTERAILVETQHGKRQAWLPTSQIDYDNEHVSLPLWLMQEKFPTFPASEVTTEEATA